MSWLRKFVSRFKKPKALYPESLWNVSAGKAGFRAIDQTGKTTFVSRDDLSFVAIATDESGPWGADVWWLLHRADGQLACGFPQGASGEKSVLDALMALPGFDHNKMIEAMSCTSNAIFVVWRR